MPSKAAATAPVAKVITVPMIFEKLTKNMVRYAADNPGAVVTTVYVSKVAFPSEPPREVTLTITVEA